MHANAHNPPYLIDLLELFLVHKRPYKRETLPFGEERSEHLPGVNGREHMRVVWSSQTYEDNCKEDEISCHLADAVTFERVLVEPWLGTQRWWRRR